MAKSNHGRVGDALELLNRGLSPFVERELQAVHGDQWQEMVAQTLREDRGSGKRLCKGEGQLGYLTTCLRLCGTMERGFSATTLVIRTRSLGSETAGVRNRWAHQTPFSSDRCHSEADRRRPLSYGHLGPPSKGTGEQRMALLRVRSTSSAEERSQRHAVAPQRYPQRA